MITVRITYDPYHMTTSMNIGGINVKRATGTYDKIKKYVTKKIPLQSWLDASRFQDWKGLLLEIIGNSNEDVVHFTTYLHKEKKFSEFETIIPGVSMDAAWRIATIVPIPTTPMPNWSQTEVSTSC